MYLIVLAPTLCGGEDIAKIVLENDDSEESSDADSDSGPEITESYQKVVWNEPSPDPVETSLENAINTTPMKEIRQLLIDLVRTQSAVQEAVAKRLTAPIPGPGNRKRKAYETCVHCDEEYQVTENEEGDCIYHPGMSIGKDYVAYCLTYGWQASGKLTTNTPSGQIQTTIGRNLTRSSFRRHIYGTAVPSEATRMLASLPGMRTQMNRASA